MSDIESLLKPAQWVEVISHRPTKDRMFAWHSIVGSYRIWYFSRDRTWNWKGEWETRIVESESEAKAACWADYVSRIKQAFKE